MARSADEAQSGYGADGPVPTATFCRARIHPSFVFPAKLGMQESNDAVMLQLLADWPHENRTHRTPPNDWINSNLKTRKLSTILSSWAFSMLGYP
jgi:hypothetical protein